MSVAAPERQLPVVENHTEAPEARQPKSIESAINDTLAMFGEKGLPIFDKKNEVAELIKGNEVSIIEGETGSGKSTVTPILALSVAQSEVRDGMGRVMVTQPRRVAAESIYKYLSTTMGDRVGYRHGGGSSVTANTQLEFAVERTLLNDIVKGDDPLLSKYDSVVVDEVHEGTVDSSILLALLKDIQAKRRSTPKPLKILLTSATLDKDKMINYFTDTEDSSGKAPGHIKVDGKMFDVEEHFEDKKVDIRDIERTAAQKVFDIHLKGNEPGDMLVFMPGAREITRTIEALDQLRQAQGISVDAIEFIAIKGGDDSADAMRKLYEKSDKRRIFVATNVAETSVTIPSVRVVIDSGLMRQNKFDPDTGISGLVTDRVTKSNARQRKGRAGRVAEGNVHYLYTREEYASMRDHLAPEILRTDLAAQVLLMKQLGINDVSNFDFIDHPGKDKIANAISTLEFLGALESDGTLSDIGKQMIEINTEPRFARMLVEAKKLGVEEEVALVIGMIQNARYDLMQPGRKISDPIFSQFIVPSSDIGTRIKIWNEYIQHNSNKKEREAWEQSTQFRTIGFYKAAGSRAEILRGRNIKDGIIDLTPEKLGNIHQAIAVGLLDNAIKKDGGVYKTYAGVKGIKIDDRSSVLAARMPDGFISTNLRKTERGTIASLNFEAIVDFERNAEESEKTTSKDSGIDHETAQAVEKVTKEIEEHTAQASTAHSPAKHSPSSSSHHSEAKDAHGGHGSEHGNAIQKIEAQIKELMHKFGSSPIRHPFEAFQTKAREWQRKLQGK